MTHLREHWEGVSLPGDFTLEQWMGGDENAAYFQSAAADGRRTLVKIVPEAAVDSGEQLDLWQRARHLRHPNLLEVLDSGRADLGGEIVLYAVYEAFDDTLSSAIANGALTREEARDVVDAVLGALRYLHQQGLVAGVVDAEHVLAVGETVKLSTDSLREAHGSADYADDVRALGGLWREALMPVSPRSAEIVAHTADADPQTRWTLAEVEAALQPALAPARAPEPMRPAIAPVVTPPVAPPAIEAVAPPLKQTAPPILPPAHHPRALDPEPERVAVPHKFPKWVLAAAAALLLLILGLNWRRGTTPTVATETRVAPVAATPAPSAATAAPARNPEPVAPKPSPLAATRGAWRVIAFTYRSRDAAEKKVRQINERHPHLHASVFVPQAKRGYYLVALGGPMTRDEAVRLQHTARGRGLPRDLYVQNYSE